MSSKTFSNHEIVTFAVFLLGGDKTYVDTEDVAIKASELASGRFGWRKYPGQVDLGKIRDSLSDARKEKNGKYLVGDFDVGWLLSAVGLEFSRQRIRELKEVDLSRKPLTKQDRLWLNRERVRMLSSVAYEKARSEGVNSVTSQEAEAFFRLDDYVVGESRERKITRILNAFDIDPELAEITKLLSKKVPIK